MSKVRIVGGYPPVIEIDGVNMAKAVSEVELVMGLGDVPRVHLTIPAVEIDLELDADVTKMLDSIPERDDPPATTFWRPIDGKGQPL